MKRNARLVALTQAFTESPHKLLSLSDFARTLEAAKSSISEDIDIVDETLKELDLGWIETISGASGGARYVPFISQEQAKKKISTLAEALSDNDRVLPGNYIYLSDILGDVDLLRDIGMVVASYFYDQDIDVIMTTATKGVPFAQAVSYYLNLPFVIVRRDSKITEGSTVSINYLSKSANRIEKMELSRRSLARGSKVLLVDDFMNGGGTFQGMTSLVEEFESEIVGAIALCDNISQEEKRFEQYLSLLKIETTEVEDGTLSISLGSIFETYPDILNK